VSKAGPKAGLQGCSKVDMSNSPSGLSWVSEEMSFEGAPVRPAYVDSANQALARFWVGAAINPARTQLL